MPLIDAKTVAKMLGTSATTVVRLGQSGELRRHKIRRLVRFEESDVEEYIERSAAPAPKQKQKVPQVDYYPGMKFVSARR